MDYKYIFFDGSVVLMKVFHAIRSNRYHDIPTKDSEGKLIFDEKGEVVLHYEYTFNANDVIKGVYWKISKFLREIASAEKCFIVFDKSPYHKIDLLPDYKGDRHHYSEDELETIDPISDPVSYIQYKEELRAESIKQEAKRWIVDNFSQLGFNILTHQGYEADDWIYLISEALKDDEEVSAIVSIDSDWTYFTKPNMVFIKFNGDEIYYEDKIKEVEDLDISLYQYKSYYDSLYGSHNNLDGVVKEEFDLSTVELIKRLRSGDFSAISDKELFDLQLKSFDVDNYPEIELVRNSISKIPTMGSIVPLDQFSLFCTFTGLYGISESYYEKTINTLNKDLYTEEVRTFGGL